MIRHVCILFLLSWALPATAGEWRMVPDQSRLEFIATYEREAAPGAFTEFDAYLRFDPQRPADGRLRVSVATTSADMGSAELYEGMATTEWFDMARFPKAEFISEDIRQTDKGRYAAHGSLRVKGIERKVTVPFAWMEKGDTATLTGEVTLDRSNFAIGTGEWATGDPIGLKVTVKYRVTLRRGT